MSRVERAVVDNIARIAGEIAFERLSETASWFRLAKSNQKVKVLIGVGWDTINTFGDAILCKVWDRDNKSRAKFLTESGLVSEKVTSYWKNREQYPNLYKRIDENNRMVRETLQQTNKLKEADFDPKNTVLSGSSNLTDRMSNNKIPSNTTCHLLKSRLENIVNLQDPQDMQQNIQSLLNWLDDNSRGQSDPNENATNLKPTAVKRRVLSTPTYSQKRRKVAPTTYNGECLMSTEPTKKNMAEIDENMAIEYYKRWFFY